MVVSLKQTNRIEAKTIINKLRSFRACNGTKCVDKIMHFTDNLILVLHAIPCKYELLRKLVFHIFLQLFAQCLSCSEGCLNLCI